MSSSLFEIFSFLFVSMRRQCLTKPRAVVPGFVAGGQALFVARAFAFDHIEKIHPIDLAVVIVATRFVPFQILVWQLKP